MRGLLLLMTAAVAAAAAVAPEKCGKCVCEELEPEVLGGATLLLNCSDVAAAADGAVPVPEAAALEGAWARAAAAEGGVHAEFRRTGAERVLPLSLPDTGAPLTLLDLSENELRALPVGVFSTVRDELHELRLDSNLMEELEGDALRPLHVLHTLSVVHNNLTVLDLSAIPPNLAVLDVSENNITKILEPSTGQPVKLQELDLSDNDLTALTADSFKALPLLQTLRLAGNPLLTVHLYFASPLSALASLDLSRCGLTALRLAAHPKLRRLRLAENALPAADAAALAAALASLEALDLSANGLTEFPLSAQHVSLKELNLSGNALTSLPEPLPSLPALESLDLSRNALASAPPALRAPALAALRHLWLDGNPLDELRLTGPLPQLRRLSVEQCGLAGVGAGALEGLRAPKGSPAPACRAEDEPQDGGDPPGLALDLSHNAHFTTVDPRAFEGLPLCELDVSWCALTSLPEEAADWERLRAVDLQGNPWDCACSMQWVLDRVLKPTYERGNRQLLYELRCETPADLRGRRLVHFYNWSQALCLPRETLQRMQRMQGGEGDGDAQTASISASRGMLIALCAVGAIFLFTVLAGLTMHHQRVAQLRRQNRRL